MVSRLSATNGLKTDANELLDAFRGGSSILQCSQDLVYCCLYVVSDSVVVAFNEGLTVSFL